LENLQNSWGGIKHNPLIDNSRRSIEPAQDDMRKRRIGEMIIGRGYMYKGWAIKSSPCTATVNDLLFFQLVGEIRVLGE
jgi:hypothetical protein